MACACKATEQISYIQKKYGVNQPKQRKGKIENPLGLISDFTVFLIIVVISPLMFIGTIFYTLIRPKKTINIAKLFRLGKYNSTYGRKH